MIEYMKNLWRRWFGTEPKTSEPVEDVAHANASGAEDVAPPKPTPEQLRRWDAQRAADQLYFQRICVRVQRWLKHHDLRSCVPPSHIKSKIAIIRRQDPKLLDNMVQYAVTRGSVYAHSEIETALVRHQTHGHRRGRQRRRRRDPLLHQ